ncbi:hypothetical protein R5R35_000252 [Gryllus longicercus]|uniref:Complex 1 LYR protein domain-containing protein n=1 Tax=Gryllus longicercus TaxID=2509291 RepID=A0AAN9Z9W5_9ORTH
MANSRSVVLKLYKTMLREALEFDSYNFRMYALRRIRDGFRENMNIKDKAEISEMISYAKENLDIIKRQTTVGKLYSAEKLIIENSEPRENKLSSEKVIA